MGKWMIVLIYRVLIGIGPTLSATASDVWDPSDHAVIYIIGIKWEVRHWFNI